jgi:RimJ/RimL family protein N-acetyltransferase
MVILKDNKYSIRDFRHEVYLRDGSRVVIRPTSASDKSAVLRLFKSLSVETRFLRYHYVKPGLSQKELDDYCNCNGDSTIVLGAERLTGNKNEIIGLARYDLFPDGLSVEISFLVDDSEQGKGLCTTMLKDLILLAHNRGFRKFIAVMLNENTIMRDILLKFDPHLKQDIDTNSNISSFYW